MKNLSRVYIIGITICFMLIVFQGCGQYKPEGSIITETESPQVSTKQDVTELDAAVAQSPILDNGLRITDIARFLNQSEDDLIKNYKDNIEYVRQNGYYKEYLYQDYGINIVCCIKDKLEENYIAKYIELDKEKVSFNGITSNMNFMQVMGILGEAKIHTLEDGLPDLMTYELRYRYKDINLRIYSYDKNGDSGIYMSIVDDFLPEYRLIRITPKEINNYFSSTRDELEKEIGKGEILYDDNDWVSYPKYGVDFIYDKQELSAILLLSNYQINDLKKGIRIEQVMKIMGERPIQEESTENGQSYSIEYKYDNFILEIGYYPDAGWYTTWGIIGNNYTNDQNTWD